MYDVKISNDIEEICNPRYHTDDVNRMIVFRIISRLISRIPWREVTWNACMTACSNGQKAELALDLFQEFKCHGNVSTVTWLRSDLVFESLVAGRFKLRQAVEVRMHHLGYMQLSDESGPSALSTSLLRPWPTQPSQHVFQPTRGSLPWSCSNSYSGDGLRRCFGTNWWVKSLGYQMHPSICSFCACWSIHCEDFGPYPDTPHAKSIYKKSAAQLNGQAKSLDAAADRVSFNTTLAACAAGQARIFNKNFGRKQCLCNVWSCIQKLDEKSIYTCPPLT